MPSVRTVVAWLSLSSLVLAGCAGQPVSPYVPEAIPQSARLLMRGTLQPGDAYGVYLFAGAVDCTQMQRVAYGLPGKDPAATRIPAERLTTLEVLVAKADRSACRMRWSFVPHAGRSYAVSASSRPGGCATLVMDVSDPDHPVLEPSLRRRDAPGSMCVALASTKPAGGNGAANAATSSSGELPSGVTDDDLRGLTGR